VNTSWPIMLCDAVLSTDTTNTHELRKSAHRINTFHTKPQSHLRSIHTQHDRNDSGTFPAAVVGYLRVWIQILLMYGLADPEQVARKRRIYRSRTCPCLGQLQRPSGYCLPTIELLSKSMYIRIQGTGYVHLPIRADSAYQN
jgi:hypothetical protein